MYPKINSKQMKKMMKQMGVRMEELQAKEVIIKLPDSDIIIENPSVAVVSAMGQKSYQITGTEKIKRNIPIEDVKLVAAQTNVGEDEARGALEKTNGNLAEAILLLKDKVRT